MKRFFLRLAILLTVEQGDYYIENNAPPVLCYLSMTLGSRSAVRHNSMRSYATALPNYANLNPAVLMVVNGFAQRHCIRKYSVTDRRSDLWRAAHSSIVVTGAWMIAISAAFAAHDMAPAPDSSLIESRDTSKLASSDMQRFRPISEK